jgi:hypothetical protein
MTEHKQYRVRHIWIEVGMCGGFPCYKIIRKCCGYEIMVRCFGNKTEAEKFLKDHLRED